MEWAVLLSEARAKGVNSQRGKKRGRAELGGRPGLGTPECQAGREHEEELGQRFKSVLERVEGVLEKKPNFCPRGNGTRGRAADAGAASCHPPESSRACCDGNGAARQACTAAGPQLLGWPRGLQPRHESRLQHGPRQHARQRGAAWLLPSCLHPWREHHHRRLSGLDEERHYALGGGHEGDGGAR